VWCENKHRGDYITVILSDLSYAHRHKHKLTQHFISHFPDKSGLTSYPLIFLKRKNAYENDIKLENGNKSIFSLSPGQTMKDNASKIHIFMTHMHIILISFLRLMAI